MVTSKGNKAPKQPGQKMLTVYVERELYKAFKRRLEEIDLDVSKTIRQMIAEYIAKDRSQIEKEAKVWQREALNNEILAGIRHFAIRNADRPRVVSGIEDAMELAQGTFAKLANTE